MNCNLCFVTLHIRTLIYRYIYIVSINYYIGYSYKHNTIGIVAIAFGKPTATTIKFIKFTIFP